MDKKCVITFNGFKITTLSCDVATVEYNGKKYNLYANSSDQLLTLWSNDDPEDYCKCAVTDIVVNNIFRSEDEVSMQECIEETCTALESMIKKLDILVKFCEIATNM